MPSVRTPVTRTRREGSLPTRRGVPLSRHDLAFARDGDQQVVGADVTVMEKAALLLGQDDYQASLLIKALERHGVDPGTVGITDDV